MADAAGKDLSPAEVKWARFVREGWVCARRVAELGKHKPASPVRQPLADARPNLLANGRNHHC